MAPATRRNYDSPPARLSLFCSLSNYRPRNEEYFPARVTWLIEWLCSFAGTIKIKMMKLYLCGIKSYQGDLGIESTAFTDRRLERTVQGINMDHNEPERRNRKPLTRPYLFYILHHLDLSTYDDTATWAACTLAFAAFRRVGEFTYREADTSTGPAFQKWFLTKDNI